MTSWQYTDATNTIVFRVLENGSTESMFASLVPDGENILPFVPSPDELQASIVAATQARLDEFARTRNYDGILSACTYATSSVPKFQSEGLYAVNARDATWGALYAFLAEVLSGTRPMPTGFDDVEPLLPALEWPQ